MELFAEFMILPNDPKCIVSLPNGKELGIMEQMAFRDLTMDINVVSFDDGSKIVILNPLSKPKRTDDLPGIQDLHLKHSYHDVSLIAVMQGVAGTSDLYEFARDSVVLGSKGDELSADDKILALHRQVSTIAVYEPQGNGSWTFWIDPPANNGKFNAAMKQPGQKPADGLKGGVDLNAQKMQLNTRGQKVDMTFDPAMIAQFMRGDFTGLTPVILGITPITNIRPLLGFAPESVGDQAKNVGVMSLAVRREEENSSM